MSGSSIIQDNMQSINSLDFPWNIIYQSGDALCHQKSERSFFLNENQMPFCARCTAILVGTDRKKIVNESSKLLNNHKDYERMSKAVNPYGDGNTSKRIVDILTSYS